MVEGWRRNCEIKITKWKAKQSSQIKEEDEEQDINEKEDVLDGDVDHSQEENSSRRNE